LLFSAKESVYKAWYPLTRRWLGFEDASIRLHAVDPCFVATLMVPGPRVAGREVRAMTGRWTAARGLLVTGVTLATAVGDEGTG
jgi:4'-phosphopantetheinyl transferase EntD